MSRESLTLPVFEVADAYLASPEESFDSELQEYLLAHGRATCSFSPAKKQDGQKKDWNMGYTTCNGGLDHDTLHKIQSSGIAASWREKIRPLIDASEVYSTIEINQLTVDTAIPEEGIPAWKNRVQQNMSSVIPNYAFEDVPASVIHGKVGPYRESTDRDGYLEFWITLPEDVVKQLEVEIKQNPSLTRALLGLYFPDVYENLEPALSKDDSVLILDNNWKDVFEMSDNGLPVAIKEGAIKRFHYE